MSSHTDTIVALATPLGTSAVALVRISGPDTERLLRDLLGRTPPPRQAVHANYRGKDGELIDDVLVTYFAGPRSYTGEDLLEVGCHGNPFIAQKIVEDLLRRGCRGAEPGEFTQRAFLAGKMDLSQAEAVMDLIHARSTRALAAANDQLRGALGRKMAELVEKVLGILARVEVYIDFPEEDLPDEDRGTLTSQIQQLTIGTSRLLATSHYGELLRDGLKTVIAGEPNVGKSSLLNRLVGRERALVSPEPGTTRDFIEERIMVGPHSLRLIDTAGLNPSPAPLERLGMELTRERLEEADLVLAVVDGSRVSAASPMVFPETPPRARVIQVINKSDLMQAGVGLLPIEGETDRIIVSAATGAGIDALREKISQVADSFQVEVGPEVIAVNARHARALGDALEALSRAGEMLRDGAPTELLASELRTVLDAYGRITGRVDNERMLDHLFASFCIGK